MLKILLYCKFTNQNYLDMIAMVVVKTFKFE